MTIETITEHGDPSPDPERDDPILPAQSDDARAPADAALQGHATATIKRLLQEHPAVAKEIKDTLRTRVYLRELAGRTNQAEETEADTEQHESNLAVKLDPGDHRILGFGLGLAIVVALVVLDAVPLNWAAQAFGLNSAGTWLVTFILVVASIGAMLGFEITRGHPRRRGRARGGGHHGVPRAAGAPHRVPDHGVQRLAPGRRPAVRPADRHLGRPGPVRLGGPGPDPVP